MVSLIWLQPKSGWLDGESVINNYPKNTDTNKVVATYAPYCNRLYKSNDDGLSIEKLEISRLLAPVFLKNPELTVKSHYSFA